MKASFLCYDFKLSTIHLKLFFSSSGHPTFKCPLCQESNFTRQRLLDHCNSNHLFQIVPVVSTYVEDVLLLKYTVPFVSFHFMCTRERS